MFVSVVCICRLYLSFVSVVCICCLFLLLVSVLCISRFYFVYTGRKEEEERADVHLKSNNPTLRGGEQFKAQICRKEGRTGQLAARVRSLRPKHQTKSSFASRREGVGGLKQKHKDH